MADLTPEQWLTKLCKQLADRRSTYDKLEQYWRNEPPPQTGVSERHRLAYERFWRKCRQNLASLIVSSARERMNVVGFRTGVEGDEVLDELAWQIWQANNMDALSIPLFSTKLALGDSYTIVGDVDDDTGAPLITIEDPRNTTAIVDPVNRRKVLAALKVYHDSVHEEDVAHLMLRGADGGNAVQYIARQRNTAETVNVASPNFTFDDDITPEVLKTKAVPVVWFPNRADINGKTMGEFEDVIDEIDRANMMLLQRVFVAVMQAFRQRAIKGELPDKDENGDDIDYSRVFELGPAALWELPAGVDIWESAQVDLRPLLDASKDDVRGICATTRTPLFYMFPDAANGSAEGASLQREGLIFRVHDRIRETTEGLETMMALAFEVLGQDAPRDMEAMWQPPEHSSLAEQHDANVKAQAGGVPFETRMRTILRYSPQEIDRMKRELAEEAASDPLTRLAAETTRQLEPVMVTDGENTGGSATDRAASA